MILPSLLASSRTKQRLNRPQVVTTPRCCAHTATTHLRDAHSASSAHAPPRRKGAVQRPRTQRRSPPQEALVSHASRAERGAGLEDGAGAACAAHLPSKHRRPNLHST